MFKNYFKIAFRNFIRHKAFTAINIIGLTIGMASSILIFLWVSNELSYDKFHKNADEIFRITADAGNFNAAVNCAGMPPELKAKIPAVENYVRLSHPVTTVFEEGEKKFEEKNVFYADSTFLQVFSFPLVQGNAVTALMRPDAVLITENMARKYFGNSDPIDRQIKKDGKNIVVTGVLKNIPPNSHLQFDFILPISAIAQTDNDLKTAAWQNFNYYGYIQLRKDFVTKPHNISKLTTQINTLYKEHVEESKLKVAFHLQPLTSIHLHSNYQVDLPGHGNIQYVNIFFIVAIFILVVACINFMNLATARSARRAKEIGLRKVVGAARAQLIGQFLGESVLISFIAFLLSIALVWLLLPAFNNVAGKQLAINLLSGKILMILAGMAIATGLISGSYPALFLSAFKPAKVLKGNMKSMGGNLTFRNALVVIQFVVSIVLLAGTAVVYRQLSYIKEMNLGFNKSDLLYMPMAGEMWQKQQPLRAALSENPLTANYTILNDLPVNLESGSVDVQWPGKDPNTQVVFPTLFVDENFLDVFNIKLLSGRAFSAARKADSSSFILNEKAVKVMGMTVPGAIGQPLSLWDIKGTIIGVVKDFNYKPIQTPVEPMIIGLNKWGGVTVVRTQPGKTEAAIKALSKISADLNPQYPFSYSFLDQDIENLYKGEQRMGKLFNLFAVLAIFISCIGLYGLSAFMAEQRRKEIGIRKVLGASAFGVVRLLSSGFTKLILIAVVIAIPIAWYGINSWLETFSYRINANWIIFLVAALSALAIAWLTVGYESIKAAIANPVKSLRNE